MEEKKFETVNKELDKIIQKLEMGNLSLEESLKLFKKAEMMINNCENEFDNVKGELLIIKDNLEHKLKIDKD